MSIGQAQLALFERLLHPPTKGAFGRQWRMGGAAPSPDYARAPRVSVDRWSLSLWALGREGVASTAIVDQPTLGGTQIGARLAYRIDRGGYWEGFARVSSAGAIGSAAEGAVGIAWRPAHSLPLRIAVERRQRLFGNAGRNAFAAYVSGGVSAVSLPHDWQLDGYGAAGVVGTVQSLPFAEGQIAVTRRIVRHGGLNIAAGGGVWAGVQANESRLDIGPRLVIDVGPPLPRIALDWRQRVAGNAAPASGPALSVGVDF